MKVAVLGGTGYLGNSICQTLRKHNIEYVSLSRKNIYNDKNFKQADVSSLDSLIEGFNGCDIVIHLVGIIRETKNIKYKDIHIKGTKNVLNAAKQNNIKQVIYASAIGVRNDVKASLYHTTKFQAEELIKNSGINYTIIRPSFIFGPKDISINFFAKTIKTYHIFPLFEGGSHVIRPIYIDDVSTIFVKSINNPKYFNKTYEIGGPEEYTYKNLLDQISKITNNFYLPLPSPQGIIFTLSKGMGKYEFFPMSYNQALMVYEDNTCNLDFNKDYDLKLHSFKEEFKKYYKKVI